MTIHLVYVKGDSISTPFAVTNELSSRLSKRTEVKIYDWSEKSAILPSPGDILLGHPYPFPGRIFQRSFRQRGWEKRIILCPFTHSLPHYISFLDQYIEDCDAYLAITGEYWMKTLDHSICSHWGEKIIRMDLGINLSHFPFIKNAFSPPGKRKFVYIGRNADYKGIDFFLKLAKQNPNIEFGWIGDTRYYGSEVKRHGAVDFSSEEGRRLVASYDFLITCGRADANPTTILEAAAFGLNVVCTPQSGYSETSWITNIPLDDVNEASRILNELSFKDEKALIEAQRVARADLKDRFSWDKFERLAWEAISGEKRPSPRFKVPLEIKIKNKALLKRNYFLTLLIGYARHAYDRTLSVLRRIGRKVK